MADNDPEDGAAATPEVALQNAAAAIKRLEGADATKRSPTTGPTLVVIVVCVLALTGLTVHTFYETDAPKVDETSVLLLAVLLFAPFVRHLRSIELGGARAEWKEDASEGLRDILMAVKEQHAAITRVYADVVSQAAAEDVDVAPADAAEDGSPSEEEATVRPLRRILWVDDKPEGNTYETESLRKLFEVHPVTTSSEARRLLDAGGFDAVISNIVRVEAGEQDPQAGAALAAHVSAMDPPLPIFFYSSPSTVELQAQYLLDRGAATVTASYTELVKALRREARVRFDTTVRHAIKHSSAVQAFEEQQDDLDYVLQLKDGRRFVVETPHWLHTPTKAAIDARYHKLSRAIADGQAAGAIIVTQKDVLIPQQYRRAPDGVRLVNLDDLAAQLEAL